MRISRTVGAVVAMLFAALAVAGEAEWKDLLDKGKKEGKAVLAGPPFRDLRQALIDGFQKDTGITLDYVAISPGDLVPRVLREHASGRPTMDAVLGGARSAYVLYERGVRESLAPKLVMPEVEDKSKWRKKQLKWIDKEGQHLL